MTDETNVRKERIEKLLAELKYEITRGVMEREIEPEMLYNQLMPGGPTGQVLLNVQLRPLRRDDYFFSHDKKLRVVGEDGS